MTKPTLDLETARRLARDVVEGNEDYIYDRTALGRDAPDGQYDCVYTTRDNRPSCVVGHMLLAAGVAAEELHKVDWDPAFLKDHNLPGASIRGVAHLFVETDPKTVAFLSELQRAQDCGLTWGMSLNRAESFANNGDKVF